MQRQTLANAGSLYRGAFATAALATGLFAMSAVHRAGVAVHGSSPSMREELAETPADWATLPPVAQWRADMVLTGRDESFELASTSTNSQAWLGDVFVRYRVTTCGWGGSACAGSSPTLDNVWFGSLDTRSEPSFPLAFRCTASPPFAYNAPPPEQHESCDPSTFVVRSDGTRFVLTIRDPDPVEVPLATIVRSPSRVLAPWSTPAWSIDRALLCAVAGVLFLMGVLALVRARRFRRLLSWTPTEVRGKDVLVEPRARRVGTAYRDSVPLLPTQIYRGTLGLVASQTDLAARVALVALLLSALVSLVGFLAY